MFELMPEQENEPKLHPNLQKYGGEGQVSLTEEDIEKMGEKKKVDDNVIELEDRRPKEMPTEDTPREVPLKRGQKARLEDLDKRRAQQKAEEEAKKEAEEESLEEARRKISSL